MSIIWLLLAFAITATNAQSCSGNCSTGTDCYWDVCCQGFCQHIPISYENGLTLMKNNIPEVNNVNGTGALPFCNPWVETDQNNTVISYTHTSPDVPGFNFTGNPVGVNSSIHFMKKLALDTSKMDIVSVNYTLGDFAYGLGGGFPLPTVYIWTLVMGIAVTNGSVPTSFIPKTCLEVTAVVGSDFNYFPCSVVAPGVPNITINGTNVFNVSAPFINRGSYDIFSNEIVDNGTWIVATFYCTYTIGFPGNGCGTGTTPTIPILYNVNPVWNQGCAGNFNCSDLNVCSEGTCIAGASRQCLSSGDEVEQCFYTACNPATNQCERNQRPVDTGCVNDNFCDYLATCNAAGECESIREYAGCETLDEICGSQVCVADVAQQLNLAFTYEQQGGHLFAQSIALDYEGYTTVTSISPGAIAVWCNQTFTGSYAGYNQSVHQTLYPTNFSSDARVGTAVDISGDGSVIVAGAPGDYPPGNPVYAMDPAIYPYYDTGLAPLYVARPGAVAVWRQSVNASFSSTPSDCSYNFLQKIVPYEVRNDSQAGYSVSTCNTGLVIAIGGPGHNNGTGAAWIYIWDTASGMFIQNGTTGPLTVTGLNSTMAMFGTSVSLSPDCTYLVVGAPGDSGMQGSTWVFSGSPSTSSWTQVAKLVGTGGLGGYETQQGRDVAASAGAQTIVIGGATDTYAYPTNGNPFGSVWIFEKTSASTWAQFEVFQGASSTYPLASYIQNFGFSVDISDAGLWLVIGARSSVGLGNSVISVGAGAAEQAYPYFRTNVNETFIPYPPQPSLGWTTGLPVYPQFGQVVVAGAGEVYGCINRVYNAGSNIGQTAYLATLYIPNFLTPLCLQASNNGSSCTPPIQATCVVGGMCGTDIHYCQPSYNDTACASFLANPCVSNATCDPYSCTADYVDPDTGCAITFSGSPACNATNFTVCGARESYGPCGTDAFCDCSPTVCNYDGVCNFDELETCSDCISEPCVPDTRCTINENAHICPQDCEGCFNDGMCAQGENASCPDCVQC